MPQAGRRTGGARAEALLPRTVWSVFYAAAVRLRTASDKFFSDDPGKSYSSVASPCSRGAERNSGPWQTPYVVHLSRLGSGKFVISSLPLHDLAVYTTIDHALARHLDWPSDVSGQGGAATNVERDVP